VKTKGKMQDNEDTETSTDEVQSTREYKKDSAGGMDVCVDCCRGINEKNTWDIKVHNG
jgi:hypothetical protein